mmetsp:Transcript_2930/g.4940  ORF Transcript_2930/g.4940 Transcript_2930/m.4940 type:complete len:152 (-) Transcript_2930:676-1131(-)|eukprot:CAMPEP_0198200030 /NCGR_PEP_ID=MMETSP1445-20131203/3108_1 /TAXON_ID=36898 /ORGANISM="Pyramimonas sp., Strain CCMP2087" /LENGTH=151 /DNA_ID=CAMNT_0043869969 /DNA_START=204 /DNA_END=659 /DNA_ORIENTATION=-
MGKSKEAKEEVEVEVEVQVCAIAKPLANEKLSKKVLSVIKKATKRKQIKRGVKEVVKALRKDAKGFCVIAGNISPIDVISHLPVLCETHNIPYIYVPSKEDLGAASCTKRPTSCMLVLAKPAKPVKDDDEEKFKEAYTSVFDKIKASQLVF